MNIALQIYLNGLLAYDACLTQKCWLCPMVGLKSKIFAFIANNFTVDVLLQNLWIILYTYFELQRPPPPRFLLSAGSTAGGGAVPPSTRTAFHPTAMIYLLTHMQTHSHTLSERSGLASVVRHISASHDREKRRIGVTGGARAQRQPLHNSSTCGELHCDRGEPIAASRYRRAIVTNERPRAPQFVAAGLAPWYGLG